MGTWEERMTRRPARILRFDRVTLLFRIVGSSQRPLRCAVYRVETGMELRLEYEDHDDLRSSQLFPVPDDEAIAALANQWRVSLLAKGFIELPLEADGTQR